MSGHNLPLLLQVIFATDEWFAPAANLLKVNDLTQQQHIGPAPITQLLGFMSGPLAPSEHITMVHMKLCKNTKEETTRLTL